MMWCNEMPVNLLLKKTYVSGINPFGAEPRILQED